MTALRLVAEPEAELLDKLKAEHGDSIRVVSALGYTVVLKTPSRARYKKWRSDSADDRKRLDATELLLEESIIWPETSKMREMFDAKPGLYITFGGQLMELMGITQEVEKKEQ